MVYRQGSLSGLRRGGRTFGELGLQGQPDGFSVRNIFEGSFTYEGTGSGKAIFEGMFKFAASEAKKKFDRKDSAVQREEDWSASPSTEEYQKLEGKLKHNSTRERSGVDWGAIGGQEYQKREALINHWQFIRNNK